LLCVAMLWLLLRLLLRWQRIQWTGRQMANWLSGLLGMLAKKTDPIEAAALPVADAVAPIVPSLAYSMFTQRQPGMLGGRAFLASIGGLGITMRDNAIEAQIIGGNVPNFMRAIVEVKSIGLILGQTRRLSFFVAPDYLCIGDDTDNLSVPISYDHLSSIAKALGCTVPTRKMVDLIYKQAPHKLVAQPLAPTSEMQSNGYMLHQDDLIKVGKIVRGAVDGELMAGHKKDVVVSPSYAFHPGMEAIYGWNTITGQVIQPLSFAHNTAYSDYSHGGRLVACQCVLDGLPTSIDAVLRDPLLCSLLSDEGSFKN
jgi:hypothetical protein